MLEELEGFFTWDEEKSTRFWTMLHLLDGFSVTGKMIQSDCG